VVPQVDAGGPHLERLPVDAQVGLHLFCKAVGEEGGGEDVGLHDVIHADELTLQVVAADAAVGKATRILYKLVAAVDAGFGPLLPQLGPAHLILQMVEAGLSGVEEPVRAFSVLVENVFLSPPG